MLGERSGAIVGHVGHESGGKSSRPMVRRRGPVALLVVGLELLSGLTAFADGLGRSEGPSAGSENGLWHYQGGIGERHVNVCLYAPKVGVAHFNAQIR